MNAREGTVIGYIARVTGSLKLFCNGEAAIVAGSEQKMTEYMKSIQDIDCRFPVEIRKARYGDILNGLRFGGAYSFDKESYTRFLALDETECAALIDFEKGAKEAFNQKDLRFVEVRMEYAEAICDICGSSLA